MLECLLCRNEIVRKPLQVIVKRGLNDPPSKEGPLLAGSRPVAKPTTISRMITGPDPIKANEPGRPISRDVRSLAHDFDRQVQAHTE